MANNNSNESGSPNAKSTNKPWHSLVAGGAAGVFSKTATAPIERVKLLMQLQETKDHQTMRQVVRNIYREEGLLSFWRGNTPSVVQKSGNSALNFMLMDWYKLIISKSMTTIFNEKDNTANTSGSSARSARIVNSLLSGGLSGATTTTFLYPLEFLRTRLAVDTANVSKGETRKFKGMVDVISFTFKTDGFFGMYKGYGPSIFYVAMHRVVYLGGFDVLKSDVITHKKEKLALSSVKDPTTMTVSLTMSERVAIAQSVSMLAATVCYPLDTIRRRLMMQAGKDANEKKYRNTFDCVKKVWIEEGPKAFFRGLGPNLAKTVGGALLLVAYDSFLSAM